MNQNYFDEDFSDSEIAMLSDLDLQPVEKNTYEAKKATDFIYR